MQKIKSSLQMGEKQETWRLMRNEQEPWLRVKATVYTCSSSQVSQLLPQLNLLFILPTQKALDIHLFSPHASYTAVHQSGILKRFDLGYCVSVFVIH